MNGYQLLQKLYNVNSLRAVYTKNGGASFTVYVEPETDNGEQLTSEYPGAVTVRAWSVKADALKDTAGIMYYPGEGDSLTIESSNGDSLTYRLARDAYSSKFWRWRWDRPGGRIVFYTRYEADNAR